MTSLVLHYFVFISIYYIGTEKIKISELGMKSRFKLIYKLTQCNFCLAFWHAVFTTLLIDLIVWSVGWFDLIMPFFITGVYLMTLKYQEDEQN